MGHEGGAFMNGVSALINETLESSITKKLVLSKHQIC